MIRLSSVFICAILHLNGSISYPSQNLAVVMGTKSNEDIGTVLRERPITTEEPVKMNCVCSKIYDPVCGSNNQSYYNLCQLECENKAGTVHVQHQGNCIPF